MKVEISVLPNGLAVNVTSAEPGSVADITICERNRDFHVRALTKLVSEQHLADSDPHEDVHEN